MQNDYKKTWYIIYENVFNLICHIWIKAASKEAALIQLDEDEKDVRKIISCQETFNLPE